MLSMHFRGEFSDAYAGAILAVRRDHGTDIQIKRRGNRSRFWHNMHRPRLADFHKLTATGSKGARGQSWALAHIV